MAVCFLCRQSTPNYAIRAVLPALNWDRVWAKFETEPETQVETVVLCNRCNARVGALYRTESENGIVTVLKDKG